MKNATAENCLNRAVEWKKTENALDLWEAHIEDEHWTVRVGDFPAEDLYTLLVNGEKVCSFNDWPAAWKKAWSGAAITGQSVAAVVPPGQVEMQKRISALERRVSALSKDLAAVRRGNVGRKVYGGKTKPAKGARSGR